MKKSSENILFVVNGRNRKAKNILRLLINSPLPACNIIVTTRHCEAIKIAHDNCSLYSHIVAVGGDGTLHQVVNGIMMGIADSNGPVVSLIPAGTANDFAKSLSFPGNIPDFCDALKADQQVQCDIGKINCTSAEGPAQETWFINIADAGIGSAVVEEVNRQPKFLSPNLTFFRAILNAFRHYNNIPVHCKADSWEWEGYIKMFVVANGKCFGSGLIIAPHAKTYDGKFAVTIAADISTYNYLRNLPRLKRGKLIDHPKVFYKEARSIRLTSPERCPIEADGEIIGFTPAEFNILPKRLRFLVYKNKGN